MLFSSQATLLKEGPSILDLEYLPTLYESSRHMCTCKRQHKRESPKTRHPTPYSIVSRFRRGYGWKYGLPAASGVVVDSHRRRLVD